jgi:glycosyltransferase involved in cell wall biosynthesis
LEIGVSNPYQNFLSVRCDRKASVDPCIECEFFSKDAIEQFKPFITHQMTSDEFFARNTESFDIVFIDGDHSYEQSLKDLNNALKVIPVGGLVVMHDAMPIDFDSTKISNLQKGLGYNGDVWKTIVSAIRASAGYLKIGTVPYDYGVAVIKKLRPDMPEIKALDLDFYRDCSIPATNPVYDLAEFNNKKVSYFTGLYNTAQKFIERTARTVMNQTNPNWEWVLHDDSNNRSDADRLEKFFASLKDPRIKYYRFNRQSGGRIGCSKKRAANLCTGDYLAELDHDDLLMPDITEKILQHGEGFDFIYSNSASVAVNDDESFSNGEYFGEEHGFAMGYGAYRTTAALNPLNGYPTQYQEYTEVPVNPKTIRNIVGMPNHIRVWSKKFYDAIGGHNPNLAVADDYELFVRSFLAGGKFLHLDTLGYLQVNTDNRMTWVRNAEIQYLWNAVLATYDEKIKQEFELRNMEDWAYKWHSEKFGFQNYTCYHEALSLYHYYDVPPIVDADCANYVI